MLKWWLISQLLVHPGVWDVKDDDDNNENDVNENDGSYVHSFWCHLDLMTTTIIMMMLMAVG